MEELSAEKIVSLFELVKDTKGKDWKHNKSKLIKIINELVEQEVKKLNKPQVSKRNSIERQELLVGLLLLEIDEFLKDSHPLKHSSTYKQLKANQ